MEQFDEKYTQYGYSIPIHTGNQSIIKNMVLAFGLENTEIKKINYIFKEEKNVNKN